MYTGSTPENEPVPANEKIKYEMNLNIRAFQ
jgi:hypothetical protein